MASSLKTFLNSLRHPKAETSHLLNTRFFVKFRWENKNVGAIYAGTNSFNVYNTTLCQNFDYYVKSINLPNIKIGGRIISLDDVHDSPMGPPGYAKTIIPQSLVTPQEQTFTIDFYDTETSIIDNFCEPWMKNCMSPRAYLPGSESALDLKKAIPFPTAEIAVYIYPKNISIENTGDGAIRKYIITRCYPGIIDNAEYGHEDSEYIIRRVEFNFDKIYTENYMVSTALKLETAKKKAAVAQKKV